MTESEWLECETAPPLIEALPEPLSVRKLRLFMCGAVRRVWDLLPVECRVAIEASEGYADGNVSAEECAVGAKRIDQLYEELAKPWNPDGMTYALSVAADATHATPNTRERASGVCYVIEAARAWVAAEAVADSEYNAVYDETTGLEDRALALVVREVFGNPFRPAYFNPAWRTDTVLAVARRAYDAREFGTLPILADALQDAGCDSADLLNHLRDQHAEHVRGCWALDLVLGKE